MRRQAFAFLSCTAAMLLAACGGGGPTGNATGGGGSSGPSGSGNTNSNLQGVYSGTLTSPGGGTVPVYGAILPEGVGTVADVSGDVYVLPTVSVPSSISGTLQGFAGAGRLFSNGSTTVAYTLTGAATDPDSNGFYATVSAQVFQGSLSGTLQLSLQDISESTLPASDLSGTYSGYYWGSLVPVSLTLNSAGIIVGTDNNGCRITGQLSNADASYDFYNASLQITGSGCPGSLSGVAFMDVDDLAHVFASPSGFILYIGATNGASAVMLEIQE